MSERRLIVAVCGSVRPPPEAAAMAEAIGEGIVSNGWILATGGLGGIMEAASRGARSSAAWTGHQVIGVLPSDQAADANPFVDIAMPTGLGRARNAVLVQMADAVVAVHGMAGTLSEIALAWQMGTPVVCLMAGGVAQQMASTSLDDRRTDAIAGAASAEEALRWLRKRLGGFPT